MAQTPTDPRTAGNNDMEWDQVTEDENLQSLLYDMLTGPMLAGMIISNDTTVAKLHEWLENNIQSCAAEVVAGRMYMSNGDPGYPSEYCDNPVAPGRGQFCENHEEE